VHVSKSWASLESIFLASADIRSQLPEDTKVRSCCDLGVCLLPLCLCGCVWGGPPTESELYYNPSNAYWRAPVTHHPPPDPDFFTPPPPQKKTQRFEGIDAEFKELMKSAATSQPSVVMTPCIILYVCCILCVLHVCVHE
jgi:hypothetical protein